MGNRNLDDTEAGLLPLKYGDTISFRAGFKIFSSKGSSVVYESKQTSKDLTYRVIDEGSTYLKMAVAAFALIFITF